MGAVPIAEGKPSSTPASPTVPITMIYRFTASDPAASSRMNLKVLHVSSGNLYGGVETIQVTLARCHDVFPRLESHFALCFEGRLSRELTEIGAKVHKLSKVRTSKPLTIWRARRKLAALLQSVRFDVVVCHSAWPHAIF